MPKSISKYEWENRLGTVAYQSSMQGRSLRNFASQFQDKLAASDVEKLEKLAQVFVEVTKKIKEIDNRYGD